MTISIIAVDDHPIVVEGLMSMLSRLDPSLTLVTSAPGWPQLAARLDGTAAGVDRQGHSEAPQEPLQADLALVDLHRSDGTEPEAAVIGLVERGIPVVVLTSELRPVPIRRAIQAGAMGLALKSDSVEQILEVVHGALSGEFHCSSDLAFVLTSDPDIHAKLAPREVEALALLADGWPRKTVGAHMNPPVSTSTVITYINRALERYRELGRQVGSASDAIREATADGYLDTPQRLPSRGD